MNQQIANNIRKKRFEKGYKQEALAKECNMTQANISHIERGKVKPSEEKLEQIAQTLGTTPGALKYGVMIEDKNEIFYEDFEKERQQWKTIEQAKDETIEAQKMAISLLQAEIDRFKKSHKTPN